MAYLSNRMLCQVFTGFHHLFDVVHCLFDIGNFQQLVGALSIAAGRSDKTGASENSL
jgi:hypothetical protein